MFCFVKKVNYNDEKFDIYKCSCGTYKSVYSGEKPDTCDVCSSIYEKIISKSYSLIQKKNELDELVNNLLKNGVIVNGYSKI